MRDEGTDGYLCPCGSNCEDGSRHGGSGTQQRRSAGLPEYPLGGQVPESSGSSSNRAEPSGRRLLEEIGDGRRARPRCRRRRLAFCSPAVDPIVKQAAGQFDSNFTSPSAGATVMGLS